MKSRIIHKVVTIIYNHLRKSKWAVFFFPMQVKRDLQALSKEECEYYSEKIFRFLLVMILLLVVVICGAVNAYRVNSYQVNVIERPKADEEKRDVELRVGENETGLMLELWSSTPDVLSVSLFSPSGEEVPKVTAAMKEYRFTFLFEQTVVDMESIYADKRIFMEKYFAKSDDWKNFLVSIFSNRQAMLDKIEENIANGKIKARVELLP